MKNSNVLIGFLLLFLSLLNTSCRKEESVFEGATPQDRLVVGSNAYTLLTRTALHDGSSDNIIDQASCISMKLPVDVIANGVAIEVLSIEDLDLISDVFSLDPDDDDVLEIVYPATVVFADYSEAIVTNTSELEVYRNACGDENSIDDDIECIDIKYPIGISLFNTITEVLSANTVKNDHELLDFLDDLTDNHVVNIDFPIQVLLKDGSELEVNTMEQLEAVIESSKDSCDEEDTNVEDTECDDCSEEEVATIWSTCDAWEVDKLFILGINKKNDYEGFSFNFKADGSVAVSTSTSETYTGTWATTKLTLFTYLEITLPELSDINGTWTIIDLAIFHNDEARSKIELLSGLRSLRFKEECVPTGESENNNREDDDSDDDDD